MNFPHSRILAGIACGILAIAPVEAKTRKIPAHHATTSKKSKSRAKSVRALKKGRSSKAASHQTSWRNRQSAPTSDRYREIQGALKSKGYLKGEPTGVWDAGSQEALRHFQADQNIEQTGKVNSLSLIALGLGPNHTPPPSVASPSQNK